MDRSCLCIFLSILCGCGTSQNSNNLTKIIEHAREDCSQGNYTNAIQTLQNHLNYENLDLLETLAFAYESRKNFTLAAQTFEQLAHLDIKNTYPESSFYAAQIYEQIDNFYSAARCYRLYLERFPKDHCIWFALSHAEEKLNHTSAALSAYLNGLQCMDSYASEEIKHLAKLCYQNELYDMAEFWAQKSLEQNPHNLFILELLLNIADQHNDSKKVNQYLSILDTLQGNTKNLDYFREKYKTLPENNHKTESKTISSSPQNIERTLNIFNLTRNTSFISIKLTTYVHSISTSWPHCFW